MKIMASYCSAIVSGMDIMQAMFICTFPDPDIHKKVMKYLNENLHWVDRFQYFDYEVMGNCFILSTTKGFKWLKQFVENIERIANGEEPINIKIEPPIKIDEKKEEKKENKKMKNECPKYVDRVEYDKDKNLMRVYFGTSCKEEVARQLFCSYLTEVDTKHLTYEMEVEMHVVNRLYWVITISSNACDATERLFDIVIEEVLHLMYSRADVKINRDDQILVETMPRTVGELYYWGKTTLDVLKDINKASSIYEDKPIPRQYIMDIDEGLMDLEDIINELSDLAREKK